MRQILVSLVLVLVALSSASSANAQTSSPAASGPPGAPTLASTPPAPAGSASAPSPPGADRPAAHASGAVAEPRSIALRVTLSPEWGYRSFRDHEPSSTDKHYTASGVPAASLRFEFYPLALASPAIDVAKDIGITGGYSRAFGLTSKDVDTGTEVDTQWYQFGFGARYRILGGTNPLALGFTLGIQRWVFDFDSPPSNRPVAIARYTLLPVGADARYKLGNFSLFADGRFLLPLTVSPLGDRTPSGTRFGFSLALAAAMAISRMFEVEVRGAYTLFSLSLPSVAGRADQRGTALDGYLVFSAGATLLY
jgi:hypothetical protein